MKKNVVTNTHKCEHCGKSFARESTIIAHLCEPKRRWNDLNTPASRIAFDAWVKIQQRHFPSKKKNEPHEFIKNSMYLAFSRYGQYCVNSKVINPDHYTSWLMKTDVNIDKWTSDKIYEQYLHEYLDLEDSMEAVKRSVDTLLDMCEEQEIRLCDGLRLLSANKLCYKITSGRISSWLLFNCDTGVDFLGSLNEGQQQMIMPYINPDKWKRKFMAKSKETNEVREVLRAAGL
jgi:hypothetical protein